MKYGGFLTSTSKCCSFVDLRQNFFPASLVIFISGVGVSSGLREGAHPQTETQSLWTTSGRFQVLVLAYHALSRGTRSRIFRS